MKRFICVLSSLICLLLLTACNSEKAQIYTVPEKNGVKSVVCYGTVECNEIISVKIPERTSLLSFKAAQGDRINKGDVIAEYSLNGVINRICAEHDGIICDKESYSSKEKMTEFIKYFNLESLYISAQISESQSHYYSEGTAVKISGIGFDNKAYNGTIIQINSLAHNTQNGSYLSCKVSVDNPDLSILPGFTARIEFNKNIENSVTIPISAIGYDDNNYYVYKLSGEHTAKTAVEGIAIGGESFCVYKGLTAGDRILNDFTTKADK